MTKFVKGNEAIVIGALYAGCDLYFGYPITPASEIAHGAAKWFPELGRTFVQAECETASVNMMFGAAAAGKLCMTATSGPGFSLMQEGISYMAAKRGSGGDALTFFFYGYSWELGGVVAPETGHFDFGWLMKNAHGKIDAFSSPLSYSSRNLTGSTVMMSAAESVTRNGYLWFNEIDHRTHHEELWDHMALFTPYSDPNVTLPFRLGETRLFTLSF